MCLKLDLLDIGRDAESAFVHFVSGRRGNISVLNCVLTVLSYRVKDGSWPKHTFNELAARPREARSKSPSCAYMTPLTVEGLTGSGRLRPQRQLQLLGLED